MCRVALKTTELNSAQQSLIKVISQLFGNFVMQMILAEKAEALREEADSLSTVPADNCQ